MPNSAITESYFLLRLELDERTQRTKKASKRTIYVRRRSTAGARYANRKRIAETYEEAVILGVVSLPSHPVPSRTWSSPCDGPAMTNAPFPAETTLIFS
jgi:hypothetical protein